MEHLPVAAMEDGVARATRLLVQAGLDTTAWNEALNAVADACGARSGQIILTRGAEVRFHQLTRAPEGFVRDVEAFGLANPVINPRVRLGRVAGLMSPVCDQDYVDQDARRRHPIYAELFDPLDFPFNCQVVLTRSGSAMARASITRSWRQGPMDQRALKAFAALAPAIQAAARLQSALAEVETRAALATLDGLSFAAFLVNAGGAVIGMTRQGEVMTSEGRILRVRGRRLVAAWIDDQSKFEAAIAAAANVLSRSSTDWGPVALRDISGRLGDVLDIQPLPLERETLGEGPLALVISMSQKEDRGATKVVLGALGLSGAEADVAAELARGGTAQQIAASRGVSMSTVRSQIRTIFSKTGVRRQSELITLVRRLL